MQRTQLDLFSGIGGFALACRWLGIETIGFCEIEPYAQRVLRKNFPGIRIFEDVRKLQTDELPRPWIITGGYPCQPFSQAGKRRGEEDDRHLWPAMFEIIRSCRPDWVLAKNVAGHVNMGLDEVLSDLEGEDYTVQPLIIPACAVDAPHRRDRVWIVAHSSQTKYRYLGISTTNNRKQRSQKIRGENWFKYSLDYSPVAPSKWWTKDKSKSRSLLLRDDDGLSERLDRLGALGNAIVPQVAFEIINAMIVSNGAERSLPRRRDSATD